MSEEQTWSSLPEGWWPVKGFPEYMINAALDVRVIDSGHRIQEHKDKTKRGAQKRYVRLVKGMDYYTCYVWDLGVESIPPF